MSRKGRMVINEFDEYEQCERLLSNQFGSFSLIILEQLCECNPSGVLLKHKLRDFSNVLFETKCQEKNGGLVTKLHPMPVTPWTVACQAPLSMGFPRQEYCNGLPFPSPKQSGK